MNGKIVFLCLLLPAIVLQAACARKATPEPNGVDVGAFRLYVSSQPDPPKRGENEIRVRITSKERQEAIRPDRILVRAIMPAMGAMSAMRSESEMVWQTDGSNLGHVSLDMGGTWFLEVQFRPPGKPAHQAQFKLTTGVPGMIFLQSAGNGEDSPSPTAVTEMKRGENGSGAIVLSPTRQQRIGVKTAIVGRSLLTKTVRAQGRVTYDERKRSEISLKFPGFIREVFANFVGKPIEKGQPLFTIYAPELSVALGEYVSLKRMAQATQDPAVQPSRLFPLELLQIARQKLLLWDLTAGQIDALLATGEIPQYLPILSPARGVVVDKQIVQGSPVMAGQVLYRLADLSTVWIEAPIYESELSLIRTGLPVQVQPIPFPHQRFDGAVSFIAPLLDPESRSGRVRVEVSNPQNQLLPEMSVNLIIHVALGEVLALPEEAIIHSGGEMIVFVDFGEGRFVPRKVHVGQKGDRFYEVLEGVSEGERIVTGGNFLIAAESRLTAGLETFMGGDAMGTQP